MSDINNNIYDENSIDSLGIIGGVRAKPSSIGLESHSHTFIEILANAIDEAREGYGNKIIITKHKDNSISIQDFGRSVPMDKNDKGEYAYNKVFNELWSGGKYNNNEKKKRNYKYSLGTNGCGATGTNYCSDFFECTAISPNGHEYYIKYKEGIQKCELQKKPHNYDFSGTTIHWLPSKKCFRGSYIIEDIFITDILKQQSIVNANLKFIYINEINNTEEEFYYKEGIRDYILEVSKNKNITEIIQFSTEATGKEPEDDEDFDFKLNLFFAFNNEENLMEYYHNASFLENGGTPEDFIKNAFTYVIDKYIKDNGMYGKNESKIKFTDIQDSLIVISDTYSTISLYTDQVKKKIKSKFMNSFVTEFLKEQLTIYLIENPLEAKKIIEQVLINKRANDKAEKTKLDIKTKLSNASKKGLSLKIEGLKDCDMRKSKLEERIFLVNEGKSANSTIIASFDGRIMGAMGLRGRFISSLKASVEDVLKNEPALGLIKALGCGVEIPKEERKKFKDIKTFNIDDLRYGSVGLLCDADCFGKGINLSLITFFYKFMPTLLKEGRIYLVISPRYELITKKGETIYVYNEKEKLDKVKELGESNIASIGVKKGLGEFDKEEFWEYVLSPTAREKTFIQIEYPKNEEELVKWYFDTLMGENIAERKEFIKKHIVNINLDEIE